MYLKFKWNSSDKPYTTELVIFSTLIWPQEIKWNFWILTAHLQDMPNHILEYQLSTFENVDEVQVTNFTEKKKNRFSTLIWPLVIKWKLRNLIAHLQDMANHLLEYHRYSSSNVDEVLVTRLPLKMSFFDPYLTPGDKWKF